MSTGQYLKIHPSTLEALTRSGVEASTSRMRKTEIEIAIREEDMQGTSSDTGLLWFLYLFKSKVIGYKERIFYMYFL